MLLSASLKKGRTYIRIELNNLYKWYVIEY